MLELFDRHLTDEDEIDSAPIVAAIDDNDPHGFCCWDFERREVHTHTQARGSNARTGACTIPLPTGARLLRTRTGEPVAGAIRYSEQTGCLSRWDEDEFGLPAIVHEVADCEVIWPDCQCFRCQKKNHTPHASYPSTSAPSSEKNA